MKRLVGLLLLVGVLASAPTFARARGLEEFYIYPFVEYFTWEEFAGKRLLKETGQLYGIGAAATFDLSNKKLLLKVKGDLFGGVVDYDGLAQYINIVLNTVTTVPMKTDVSYIGTRIETDLGWRFGSEKGSLEPFAGLGYRWWNRDIHNGTDINGNAVSGYKEEWGSSYTRIGARFSAIQARDIRLFAEGGGKYPFYTTNTANSDTLKPKGAWSAFAELGMQYKWFRPSIFYEGFRFKESNSVPVGGGFVVFQPKSESDIYGINLGIAFK